MKPEPEPPLVLTRRLVASEAERRLEAGGAPVLRLALCADDRTRLRGHRRSVCGRELVLQLPRGEALEPGEWLASAEGRDLTQVEAASEPLLRVRAGDSLDLLRAAYHLGNRHVALQILPGELRLLEDPVLADLLQRLGLQLERRSEPFLPEAGAYAASHSHAGASEGDPG